MAKKQKAYSIGTKVCWQWLGRPILGVVKEIHLKPITMTIKTKKITRNGSNQNPAYLVESVAGNIALKLHSELQLLTKEKKAANQPQMFSDD